MDENWLNYYTPEPKLQWVTTGESVPENSKTIPPAVKVMAFRILELEPNNFRRLP